MPYTNPTITAATVRRIPCENANLREGVPPVNAVQRAFPDQFAVVGCHNEGVLGTGCGPAVAAILRRNPAGLRGRQ
ncbi:hypothetical protein A5784_02740 [Mycobacterium sp. 852013-50091_SCH5140682]|nr:hypothetical protein A5784_02740 [Mycobacterium sp. 852013-50091_SCH5140682]